MDWTFWHVYIYIYICMYVYLHSYSTYVFLGLWDLHFAYQIMAVRAMLSWSQWREHAGRWCCSWGGCGNRRDCSSKRQFKLSEMSGWCFGVFTAKLRSTFWIMVWSCPRCTVQAGCAGGLFPSFLIVVLMYQKWSSSLSTDAQSFAVLAALLWRFPTLCAFDLQVEKLQKPSAWGNILRSEQQEVERNAWDCEHVFSSLKL